MTRHLAVTIVSALSLFQGDNLWHGTFQSEQLPHPQQNLRKEYSLPLQNMNFLLDMTCVCYEEDGKTLG